MKQRKCLSTEQINYVQALITGLQPEKTITGSMIVIQSQWAHAKSELSKPVRLRDVPEIVHYLRTVKKIPVCNVGQGYYISFNTDEIMRTYMYLNSTVLSTFEAMKSLKQICADLVTKEITET